MRKLTTTSGTQPTCSMGAAAIATSAIARNRSTRAQIPCEVTASGSAGGAGIRAPARFPGALAFARVAYPIDDEAFFAKPRVQSRHAQLLSQHGRRERGHDLRGPLRAHVLDPACSTGWSRRGGQLFGTSLMAQRPLSALFGVFDLWCWFVIVRALTPHGGASPAVVGGGPTGAEI
jgi:hypothetical protein